MPTHPSSLPRRAVGEWVLTSTHPYGNPFADVVLDAVFHGPSGQTVPVPGFFDGDGTWRVRFSPNEAGEWRYAITSSPADPELSGEGTLTVTSSDARGYLVSTPNDAWGFRYESGEPVFLYGDTTYNLFGMAHCDKPVSAFLQRRAAQGFNLLRVRLPISPYHPPEGYSKWETRRTWPWGGSEQVPRFDRFNLDYFRSVDAVIQEAEGLGVGLEMIMEAWGFEYPFNRRSLFVPEWEALWMRYLLARYDAYSCVYIWTLMNEYEYYPDGDWRYNPVADRWAIRVGRDVRRVGGHGHVIAVHNGPRMPTFAKRFEQAPEVIDTIMYQEWGTRDKENGWLAIGIEDTIAKSLAGWWGSAVFAEWGYERNPDLDLRLPSHLYCCEQHTRRGAWRGAFCALGIIHGFENSWGPWCVLEEDQVGIRYLDIVRCFFTEVVSFAELAPSPERVRGPEDAGEGERPLCLATVDGGVIAVYLPVGGSVDVTLGEGAYRARWFDPCTGALNDATGGPSYVAPEAIQDGHPQDWVLLLERT